MFLLAITKWMQYGWSAVLTDITVLGLSEIYLFSHWGWKLIREKCCNFKIIFLNCEDCFSRNKYACKQSIVFHTWVTFLIKDGSVADSVCKYAWRHVGVSDYQFFFFQGIRVRALILINPHNPLGDIYPAQLLTECLEFAHRFAS